jgi:hypothetical protein
LILVGQFIGFNNGLRIVVGIDEGKITFDERDLSRMSTKS